MIQEMRRLESGACLLQYFKISQTNSPKLQEGFSLIKGRSKHGLPTWSPAPPRVPLYRPLELVWLQTLNTRYVCARWWVRPRMSRKPLFSRGCPPDGKHNHNSGAQWPLLLSNYLGPCVCQQQFFNKFVIIRTLGR